MKRSERLYALGQLSAGLAHEIRNPLASIGGAASMLRKGSLTEERRLELVGILERESRRLNNLLTSFLDFARPRSPQYRAVDAGQLLDSVIALAAHAAGRAPFTLRAETAPGLPLLECDQEQLEQVILNLAINAIQAMPDGGEIVLAARAEGAHIAIDVIDQGPGIPAEYLDRIFDPFFTTKENGTGLGLSVAHRIVQQHGGSLRVQNNGSRGTTFTIVLPARRQSP
jgi:signal transduction histidine kinase